MFTCVALHTMLSTSTYIVGSKARDNILFVEKLIPIVKVPAGTAVCKDLSHLRLITCQVHHWWHVFMHISGAEAVFSSHGA